MSIKNYLKFGWGKVRKNILPLSLFSLCVLIVSFAAGLFGDDFVSLGNIVSLLISPIIYFPLTFVSMEFLSKDKIDWKNIFSTFNKKVYTSFFLTNLVTSLGMTILVGAGVALTLLIPLVGAIITLFLFLLAFFYFSGVILIPYYRLIDQRADFWSTLKKSFLITNKKRWLLVKFLIVSGIINMLGLLALGVGVLITMPVTTIAMAKIYEDIK